MEVHVEASAAGVVCVRVDSPGHPSADTFTSLPTPSGTPFPALPDGCARVLRGSVVVWIPPTPSADPELGVCVLSVRHGGSKVAMALTGEAEWLRRRWSRGELQAKLEAAYPHLPTAWLRRVAVAMEEKGGDGPGLRVRCTFSLAYGEHA